MNMDRGKLFSPRNVVKKNGCQLIENPHHMEKKRSAAREKEANQETEIEMWVREKALQRSHLLIYLQLPQGDLVSPSAHSVNYTSIFQRTSSVAQGSSN